MGVSQLALPYPALSNLSPIQRPWPNPSHFSPLTSPNRKNAQKSDRIRSISAPCNALIAPGTRSPCFQDLPFSSRIQWKTGSIPPCLRRTQSRSCWMLKPAVFPGPSKPLSYSSPYPEMSQILQVKIRAWLMSLLIHQKFGRGFQHPRWMKCGGPVG